MDDSASFGYWVRRRRKALDLTQDALAQRVGCSVMTIRKIEGDIRRPSRQIAELLAECLEIAAHERESFIKAARAELLDAAPQLKILVTSRACLQIYGECEFPVPPLALPNPKQLPSLERLTQYEAVRLFIERARAVKPDFAISDENAPAVAEICVRLDGLPLAIELAAVRIKVLTPEALLARLSRRLHVLTGGARNLPARQQTLRNAIAWSHELLASAEQALFARLAIFAGGCTLDAIAVVCNVGSDEPLDPLDAIQSLANNSLVQQDARANAEPRLHMLETIREYAQEQMAARSEVAALHARHAAYYLQLAEAGQSKLDTGEQEVWLNRLEVEHDNMRAALTWALESRDADQAMRLGAALWRFWEMRGYITEGRRWLSTALVQSQEVSGAHRAAAYTGAGTMAFHQRDHTQAVEWHQQALELYQALGDNQGIAFALNNIGAQYSDQDNFVDAMAHFSQSLAISRQLGCTRTSAMTQHNMGQVARYQGASAQAVDLYTQSLALSRKLGDQWLACNSLVGLGATAVQQGNHVRATGLYLEAMTQCQEQGLSELLAECFEGLADCAARQGQGVRAARLFGAAERLRELIDTPLPLIESQRYTEAVALARAALDPATHKAAWTHGRSMPIEEAIAYAISRET